MKKDRFLSLLQNLKEIGVTKEELLTILNQDENILDLLSSVSLWQLERYIKIIQLYSSINYDLSEVIKV